MNIQLENLENSSMFRFGFLSTGYKLFYIEFNPEYKNQIYSQTMK
jgi:hypothetical protein